MNRLIAALALGSAAAFAPAQTGKASTALAAAPFANEIGATAPLGYFDPMGLCTDGNRANFDRLRASEIKHGRISMLATVGYLVTAAGIRFPGAEDIPGGFKALEAMPGMVWVQMAFTLAMMEAVNRDAFGLAEFPGDFRNGSKLDFDGDEKTAIPFLDFGWDNQTEEWKRKKRTIEVMNGRAAMMGILGLMVHENLGNIDEILPYGK